MSKKKTTNIWKKMKFKRNEWKNHLTNLNFNRFWSWKCYFWLFPYKWTFKLALNNIIKQKTNKKKNVKLEQTVTTKKIKIKIKKQENDGKKFRNNAQVNCNNHKENTIQENN